MPRLHLPSVAEMTPEQRDVHDEIVSGVRGQLIDSVDAIHQAPAFERGVGGQSGGDGVDVGAAGDTGLPAEPRHGAVPRGVDAAGGHHEDDAGMV